MIDGVLPRPRNLSANGTIASNCALADNDAETNMEAARRSRGDLSALASLPPTP
jgi:hypothetical protein